MTERKTRELQFESWDAVRNDLSKLAAGTYTQNGNWTLQQTCDHLKDWLSFSIDGFPKQPLPIRFLLWCIKIAVGKSSLKKILTEKSMNYGSPTNPATVHKTNGNDQQSVNALLATIERFEKHTGPIHPSPIFGKLDKSTAEQLQFVHIAHHLKLLSPNAS